MSQTMGVIASNFSVVISCQLNQKVLKKNTSFYQENV